MTVKQSNQLRRNAIRVSQSFDFMSTSQPLHQKDGPAKPQPRRLRGRGNLCLLSLGPKTPLDRVWLGSIVPRFFYVYQVCFHLMLTSLTKKMILYNYSKFYGFLIDQSTQCNLYVKLAFGLQIISLGLLCVPYLRQFKVHRLFKNSLFSPLV